LNEIKKVAVVGADKTMGSLSGGIFAQAGIPCIFFAGSIDKAQKGIENAVRQARSDVLRENMVPGMYDDLGKELPKCDWIVEAVDDELPVKRDYFQKVDRYRKTGSIVSTISSRFSIQDLAAECSEDFKAHFAGVHFFNPPGILLASELIFHPKNSGEFRLFMTRFCKSVLRRVNIIANDTPEFAGNRIGFQFLNEAAISAETHGVEKIDYVLGPHTGRALGPLAAIDLVGLHAHREAVNNIYSNVNDERRGSFKLPPYLKALADRDMPGGKGAAPGGFYKFSEKREKLVLRPSNLDYKKMTNAKDKLVEDIKLSIHDGLYRRAAEIIKKEDSDEMAFIRRFVLGYISYSFCRVGEVTPPEAGIHGIDRVMSYGFSWFPPSAWVDLFGGPKETVSLLDRCNLPVPKYLKQMPEGTHCRIPEVTKFLVTRW
jgi:3-hydroxyacyl-CoA dehydrogenase